MNVTGNPEPEYIYVRLIGIIQQARNNIHFPKEFTLTSCHACAGGCGRGEVTAGLVGISAILL